MTGNRSPTCWASLTESILIACCAESPTALTIEDRQFIAMLLRMIRNDEDARELFYETVMGTGKKPPPQAYSAAFVYLARIELKEAKAGKEAIGEVEDWSGLTAAQVDHAVRANKDRILPLIKGKDPATLAFYVRWQRDLLTPYRAK